MQLFKLVSQGGYTEKPNTRGIDKDSKKTSAKNSLESPTEFGYKCVCLNARSIVNKRNELNIMVEDIDPHIIGITESWATPDISDAELGMKFADDTKVFRKIKSDADRQHLQDDLNKLIEWSEKWQMLFNFGKCKCLHTGHGNEDAQYTMGDTVLNTTLKEKDLGLTISSDMKVSEQCGIAAAKGNQILGLIRRNIVYKEKELIIPLYKTIVRPHLEYCIQAWRPYRKKDFDMLERVQRRATKMIPKLRNISYEMRLKECGLTTLENRRLRGDQIEVFKILNGYENIDRNIFVTVKEERRTRGHGVTLAKKQCRLPG